MVTEGYQYWLSPVWCISAFMHKFFYAYLLSLVKLRLVVGTHKGGRDYLQDYLVSGQFSLTIFLLNSTEQ